MPGAFGPVSGPGAVDETALKGAALAEPGTDGVDLAGEVTTAEPYLTGTGPLRVVAYDFGIKRTILRHLGHLAGEINTLTYEGRGLCAVIAPWNFPLAIMAGMTAAAIVCGEGRGIV